MFPNVFLTDLNSNVVHHGKRLTFYRIFHATPRHFLGIYIGSHFISLYKALHCQEKQVTGYISDDGNHTQGRDRRHSLH